ELVWVREMARFQVDEQLSPRDKRVAHIKSMLEEYHASPLRRGFEVRYGAAFHLGDAPSKGHRSPIEAPSKGDTGDEVEAGSPLEAPPKPESRNREQKQRTD